MRTGRLHPAEPLAEEGLVDSRDRAEPAAGVAVHRGIADGRFAAIAGGEQQRFAQIRQHPDAGRPNPGLDVLQRDVVALPGQFATFGLGDHGDVPLDQFVDVELDEFRPHRFGHRTGRFAGLLGTVSRRLVDAGQQMIDDLARRLDIGQFGIVVELLDESGDTQLRGGQFGHRSHERRHPRRIRPATGGDDKTVRSALAQVVHQSQRNGAGEFLLAKFLRLFPGRDFIHGGSGSGIRIAELDADAGFFIGFDVGPVAFESSALHARGVEIDIRCGQAPVGERKSRTVGDHSPELGDHRTAVVDHAAGFVP